MSPGESRCSRLAFNPRVKTGGCSTNQISSGVDASRISVNRCIARQVGSYGASPRWRIAGLGTVTCELGVVEPGVVARQRLFRAVARSHQRTGHTFQESHLQCPVAILIELPRGDESLHGEVIGRRTKVLAQGQDVDLYGAEIKHGLADFSIAFSQSQHQTGLG